MSIELESQFIRRGVWTDLSHGPILGKTITTDTQKGNLIVALLAVLSTIGTAHLWHLITFCIHQLRADGRPEDALFRQQQALLRTLPSPASVIADTIKLWWAWRSKAKRPLLRSLVLFLVAIIFAGATGAASVFSSLVVDTTNLHVLVKSRSCGWVNLIRQGEEGYRPTVRSASIPYARQCYAKERASGKMPLACNVLVNRALPFNSTRGPCPFEAEACQPNVDSVTFDTGLIDVASSFGLNMVNSDGVKFRRKMTCSLLGINEKYNRLVPYSLSFDGRLLDNTTTNPRSLLFNYGTGFGSEYENLTWALDYRISYLNTDYSIFTVSNYSNPMAPVRQGFEPRPGLFRDNHTITLIAVGLNDRKYNNEVHDPLFNATIGEPYDFISSTGTVTKDRYRSGWVGRAIGCKEQYQFCHKLPSGEDFCTEPGELPLNVWMGDQLPPPPNIDTSMFPKANDLQQTILRLLSTSAFDFNIGTMAVDLLAGSVDNPESIIGLPDNQWLLELERWEKQILASLQIAVTDYAIGPGQRDTAFPTFMRPKTPGEKRLCNMQKMKKTGDVVNINVFGLSFIIAFSCLVAILDWTILKFVIFLSRFRRALAPRVDRWIQDGVWQLQRRAYEGEGFRQWTNLEDDVPLTKAGQTFKDLPILWVPKKETTASSSQLLPGSGNSSGSHLPLNNEPFVQDEEMAEKSTKKGRVWFNMFRR